MKKIVFIAGCLLLAMLYLSNAAIAAVSPSITPVDMYTIANGAPARIATGNDGKLYITDTLRGLVYVYSNNGILLYSLDSIESPLGIVVDQTGRIYISDAKNKNVGVYNSEGRLLFKLGSGDGEFGLPNDIAVSAAGTVYVTDSKDNVVRVYSATRNPEFSFGAGLLNFPTGITVDDAAGEVFVIDHNNIYIRVYDLNGTLKRSIKGSGGMGAGKLLRPLGLAVDSTRLYITDAYHSVVAVYDKTSGTFLNYIGNYGSSLGEYKTPTDVAFDKDGKIFITNTNNQRIEVLGIDTFAGIKIEPDTINFSAYADGSTVTQTVNLSSTGNDTTWTVVISDTWLSLSATSGITPSSVDVTVNPYGLSAGTYISEVKFTTPSKTESVLVVNLEVKSPTLSVAPSAMNFVYQKNSDLLLSDSIMVSSTGAILSWNASTPESWLILDNTSGITPASINVSLADSVKYFATGAYEAEIVVDAGNVTGSPATVNVYLDVIEAGTIKVTTNLDEAGFTITGPESFSGAGMTWTAENVEPGTYSISFTHVSGYNRPYSRSFTVETGKTVEINGIYSEKPLATHIIAGSGNPDGNTVSVLSIGGVTELTIAPFDKSPGGKVASGDSIKVASGDMDGDGIDEIIVTNSRNVIKIYSADGTEIATKSLSRLANNLEITVADIDNDGKAEIVAGFIIENAKFAIITSFGLEENVYEDILMFKRNRASFTLASGDINGDGNSDLIIAEKSNISAYEINVDSKVIPWFENTLSLIWSRPLSETVRPEITAGDINDDGIDEICLALGPDASNDSLVKFLNGDGTDYGLEINVFEDYNYKYGATVTLGDIDGDGIYELAVGAGPGPTNEALIRLFESEGQYLNTIKAMDSLYGVNVSFGKLTEGE